MNVIEGRCGTAGKLQYRVKGMTCTTIFDKDESSAFQIRCRSKRHALRVQAMLGWKSHDLGEGRQKCTVSYGNTGNGHYLFQHYQLDV